MSKIIEWIILKRRNIIYKQIHEEMFIILSHKGNQIKMTLISSQTSQNGYHQENKYWRGCGGEDRKGTFCSIIGNVNSQ
jgi:hypothetical protein